MKHLSCLILFVGLPSLGIAGAVSTAPQNSAIEIAWNLPLEAKEVELRFRSERNTVISKITDISPTHPAPKTLLPSSKRDREVWHPVIDLELNAGMVAVLRWQSVFRLVAVNHHFHGKTETGQREMTVAASALESWENNVYCEPAVALEDFYFTYLTTRVPVINGCLKYAVRPLCEQWAGRAVGGLGGRN